MEQLRDQLQLHKQPILVEFQQKKKLPKNLPK
jgi:hypothetical protein